MRDKIFYTRHMSVRLEIVPDLLFSPRDVCPTYILQMRNRENIAIFQHAYVIYIIIAPMRNINIVWAVKYGFK